jgi:hypothetical protein
MKNIKLMEMCSDFLVTVSGYLKMLQNRQSASICFRTLGRRFLNLEWVVKLKFRKFCRIIFQESESSIPLISKRNPAKSQKFV